MTMRKIGCIRLRSRVSDDLGQLLSDAGLEIKARSYLQENFSCILVLFSEAFLYMYCCSCTVKNISQGDGNVPFLLNTSDLFIQTERARGYIFLMYYNYCCRSSFRA